MSVSPQLVKELRTATGAGMMDCKKALTESSGDLEKAKTILREKGIDKAKSKSSRATKEGIIGTYVHSGKIGVMVEVNCETDFVAKTNEFIAFVEDLGMHIAATAPMCVNREDVPEDVIAKERDVLIAQAKNSGKPDNIVEKVVDGRINKFYSELCLLEQPFIKEPERNIQSLLTDLIAKLGENITVRRFSRFQLGQD